MGNSTSSFWPPGKLFQRDRKQKSSRKGSQHRNVKEVPPVSPMYDTVADFPVYAVVNKPRQSNIKVEENVQYAEVEVIRKATKRSPKKPGISPKPAQSTEYATINFPPPNNTNPPYKPPPQPISTSNRINTASKSRARDRVNGTLV